MNGQTVLITGANGGIGKITAVELAKKGAHVIVASRKSEKTDGAMEEISSYGSAEHIAVDLANLQSVRQLASTVMTKHQRLDVLINNAGVFPTKLTLTDDGFEAQFGVNHLAHFLLTTELLDFIKSNNSGRIITVTSKLHKNGSIDFDSFRGEKKYSPQVAYGQSKLANVLFAIELADRLTGSTVTSNLLHPGAVRTDIMRQMPKLLRWLVNLSFIKPEEGAKTSIMLASDKELDGVNGQYYDQCELDSVAEIGKDEDLRKKLWDESEKLTRAVNH
tara:strand:+ start:743 stop:1570 length:828 start_codon:yes stop_codon:yes gene_type:complete